MLTEICSHGVLLGLLSSDPGRYDLLLITNPGVGPPEGVPPLARRVLHLQFEDFVSPRPGARLPAAEDVRLALEWSARGGDLVVSCHAGVSRSSALAYVVRCRDWSPWEAIRVLTPGWHRPNDLVVRLGAELLRDRAVYDTYAAWMGEDGPSPVPPTTRSSRPPGRRGGPRRPRR
jgi:hypothetical protein